MRQISNAVRFIRYIIAKLTANIVGRICIKRLHRCPIGYNVVTECISVRIIHIKRSTKKNVRGGLS